MIFVALLIMTLADTKATAQDQCNTQSAICIFNGRLQGTILFLEQQGFGCGISANNRGLHLDIDLQGFDPGDSATAYNFRVKSFAGLLPPTCNGMGPDFGSDPRAADLGTVARSSEGRVHSSNVLHDGPTLWGDNSLLGRSVAVTRGGPNTLQQQTPDEVLDCCIIGMVSLQYPPPSPPPTSSPDLHNNDPAFTNRHDNPTANSNNPNGFNNDDNYNNNDDNGDNNSFPGPFSAPGPSFGGDAGAAGGGGAFPGGPSFSGSSFRSPFSLDSRLDLLDLSGKTSRVHSLSPDGVGRKFRAPEPPRFEDVYGLDVGASPLARSGYGGQVGSSQGGGSSLSRLFFQDGDVESTLGLGLTPEEMDIPREAGEEESSTSFHQDRALDDDDDDGDPGYDDVTTAANGEESNQGYPSTITGEGDPPPSDDLPAPSYEEEEGDSSQASSPPSDVGVGSIEGLENDSQAPQSARDGQGGGDGLAGSSAQAAGGDNP
ncbi:uncharacterized protein LOC143283456 isoform X2 [Babylonia areolata]|uniref:uncharacterized protein LOC143283456 isoform X2 n=1 Tax=Babylonia areolata TaxID=304850 RepID=UPI003FD43382